MEIHGALYFDGKKTPTLTAGTKTVEVQGRLVVTRSKEKEVCENYPLVLYPGEHYVTHKTPTSGRGEGIAADIVNV